MRRALARTGERQNGIAVPDDVQGGHGERGSLEGRGQLPGAVERSPPRSAGSGTGTASPRPSSPAGQAAKSTLSQLEAGAGNPSVETLWALAVVLEVPFSRLVDPPEAPVHVLRAGEGRAIPSEHSPFTGTLLAACPPGARRDLHVIAAEPGPARKARAHIPGTTEHLLVTAGRWRAGPVEAQVELDPGDYARFPGDRPHVYQALEPGCAAVLVMEYV